MLVGPLIGVVGAVIGTLAGAEARARLIPTVGGIPAALIEDAVAIVVAVVVVVAVAVSI